MNPVAIFRHAPEEGPGYFADFLDRAGIPHRLIRVDANDPIPESLAGVSGLVFMGGPMSVNDDLPWIPQAVELIQRAITTNIPILGHCLGGQLIAKACGERITRNPVREIGWFPVTKTDTPSAHEWLDGLPREFEVYHWHGETFSIPPQATCILESRHCPNQAFVLGNTLALQCHVEMTRELIEHWGRAFGDKIRPSETVQTAQEMQHDIVQRIEHLHRVADVLYARWIQGLK